MASFAGDAFVQLSLKGREKFSRDLQAAEQRLSRFARVGAGFSVLTRHVNAVGSGFAGMARGGLSVVDRLNTGVNNLMLGLLGGAAAAAAGGYVLSRGLKGALNAASDLYETQDAFRRVFGEGAADAESRANGMASALGRTRREILESMTNFRAMLGPMGVASGMADDMSASLTQLALDISSARNIPVDEAMEKLRAGMSGEAEPLRVLGVNLTAAAVAARLFSDGIDPKTATEAQKAMARYNIILEQTQWMHNNLADTQDSYANQQRALAASWEEMAATLGGFFLPVAQSTVGLLADLVKYGTGVATAWFQAGGATALLSAAGTRLYQEWFHLKVLFNDIQIAILKMAETLFTVTQQVYGNQGLRTLMDNLFGKGFAGLATMGSNLKLNELRTQISQLEEERKGNADIANNVDGAATDKFNEAMTGWQQKIEDFRQSMKSEAEPYESQIKPLSPDDIKAAAGTAADSEEAKATKQAAEVKSLLSTSLASLEQFRENKRQQAQEKMQKALDGIWNTLKKPEIMIGRIDTNNGVVEA